MRHTALGPFFLFLDGSEPARELLRAALKAYELAH
jgi:hypothetical protein